MVLTLFLFTNKNPRMFCAGVCSFFGVDIAIDRERRER